MAITRDIFLNKRFIVTGLLVVFSILFLGYFTESTKVNPVFQTLLVSATFFLVVPALYCKIVLGESLKNLGWQSGNFFRGVFASVVCIAIGLGAIFLLSQFTPFPEKYLLPRIVETNFLWFMIYELILVTFAVFLYESFFRGLVELFWLRSFGFWAIFFQSVLFIALLYLSDDLSWQRVPAILFSPLAGIVAYYSRSLWYSSAASWAFFFLTDIFLLVLH